MSVAVALDFQFRYYDGHSGRFLSEDPEKGTKHSPDSFLSKYIYVANNPINYVDPSGRELFTIAFTVKLLMYAVGTYVTARAAHDAYKGAKESGLTNDQALLAGFLNGLVTGFGIYFSAGAGAAKAALIAGAVSFTNNITNQAIENDGLRGISLGRAGISAGISMAVSYWISNTVSELPGIRDFIKPLQDEFGNATGTFVGACFDNGFGKEPTYECHFGTSNVSPEPPRD